MFLQKVDGRSKIHRRYRDLYADIAEDLGGDSAMTSAEHQLARRAAGLCLLAEIGEGFLVEGKEIDFDEHVRNVNAQVSLFKALGIKRAAPEDAPTLEAYLRATSAEAEPAA